MNRPAKISKPMTNGWRDKTVKKLLKQHTKATKAAGMAKAAADLASLTAKKEKP